MTLKGRINRYLRKSGRGTPLYMLTEDREIRFTGIDRFDKRLFNAMTEVHLPDTFQWGRDEPSLLDPLRFVHTQLTGPFQYCFDPMFLLGWVSFADPRDAFLFYMMFAGQVEPLEKDPERIEMQREFIARWGLAEFTK